MPFSLSFRAFYWLGITALSIVLGIQIILLPWLVLDHLSLSSSWVGWVQTSVLIPNLLLLLLGGVFADRGQGVRWLVPVLVGSAILHGLLAASIYQDGLTIVMLLIYAVLLGVSHAFIQPWREYLLKVTQPNQVQATVARSSLCLATGQALGVAIASTMDILGAQILLMVQVAMVLLAIICFTLLIKCLPVSGAGESSQVPHRHLLMAGLQDVWQLPALRSLIVIVAFNGFFHIGVFIVALPLIVRQVYGETVEFYSGLQVAFVIGTIVATVVVIYRRFLNDPGKRVIFGLLYGGVILLALSAGPTVLGLFTLIFLWGLVVGISSTMGRAVVQSLSPEHSRGRIISIYQLALFGFAPLGALFAGYVAQIWGVMELLKLSGIASLAGFMLTLGIRGLWDVQIKEV